jgi:trimeric autotransporter adhesin
MMASGCGRRGRLTLTAAVSAAAVLAGAGAPARAADADHGRGGPAAGTISTIVGGVGGPGQATNVTLNNLMPGAGHDGPFYQPCGVSFAHGRLLIADDAVRSVNPANDRLTTVAGDDGWASPLGDGAPATQAALFACGVAQDAAGNVVLADEGSNRIRVVAAKTGTFYGQAMTKGDIYTLAGNGKQAYGGTGVPATQTELVKPVDVTLDRYGNLVIADWGRTEHAKKQPGLGARIQVVAVRSGQFYGKAMTAGDIYTVAGNEHGTTVTGDGGRATAAGLGFTLGSVTVDGTGNLLFTEQAATSVVRVVAERTGTFYGVAMTRGDIYTVAGGGTGGVGDGVPALQATISDVDGVSVDSAGNLLIADSGDNLIRVVAVTSGTFYGQAMTADDIYTLAGGGTDDHSNGIPATSASVGAPSQVTTDPAGDLLITDSDDSRVRMVPAASGTYYGQPMTKGDIYTVAGHVASTWINNGEPATSAVLNRDAAQADASGDVFVEGILDDLVWMVPASTGMFYGQQMTAGHIYTVAGNGTSGFSGDGGPATKAELFYAGPVTVDGSGNLIIPDSDNGRIRVVAARNGTFYGQSMIAGDIYSIASGLFAPAQVAMDPHGNIVISMPYSDSIQVLAATTGTFYGQAMTAGEIYTVAGIGVQGYSGDGGPAISAKLSIPGSVAADHNGNLVIADTGNNRIRVVAVSTGTFYGRAMIAGNIYTVAGTGPGGYSGDGGPATSAELDDPVSVAVDGSGNVLVADRGNDRVRVVAEAAGMFYGVPVTAGNIYTVAGNGTYAFSGDGGPATGAELASPYDVTVTSAGDLVISDVYNGRVRQVTG